MCVCVCVCVLCWLVGFKHCPYLILLLMESPGGTMDEKVAATPLASGIRVYTDDENESQSSINWVNVSFHIYIYIYIERERERERERDVTECIVCVQGHDLLTFSLSCRPFSF